MSLIKHFSDEFGEEQLPNIQDDVIKKLRKKIKKLRKKIEKLQNLLNYEKKNSASIIGGLKYSASIIGGLKLQLKKLRKKK